MLPIVISRAQPKRGRAGAALVAPSQAACELASVRCVLVAARGPKSHGVERQDGPTVFASGQGCALRRRPIAKALRPVPPTLSTERNHQKLKTHEMHACIWLQKVSCGIVCLKRVEFLKENMDKHNVS